MPIVDLARRLEDAGVRALTIHCRTAKMGHDGAADWSGARRAREVVSIPVIVNGDVRTANDCARALSSTGCQGVMIGRPYVYGLGVSGAAGVERVVQILKTELMMAMALAGVRYCLLTFRSAPENHGMPPSREKA